MAERNPNDATFKSKTQSLWEMIKCYTSKIEVEEIKHFIGWDEIEKNKQLHRERNALLDILEDIIKRTKDCNFLSQESSYESQEVKALQTQIKDILFTLGAFGLDILRQHHPKVYKYFEIVDNNFLEIVCTRHCDEIINGDYDHNMFQMQCRHKDFFHDEESCMNMYCIDEILPHIKIFFEEEKRTLENVIEQLKQRVDLSSELLFGIENMAMVSFEDLQSAKSHLQQVLQKNSEREEINLQDSSKDNLAISLQSGNSLSFYSKWKTQRNENMGDRIHVVGSKETSININSQSCKSFETSRNMFSSKCRKRIKIQEMCKAAQLDEDIDAEDLKFFTC